MPMKKILLATTIMLLMTGCAMNFASKPSSKNIPNTNEDRSAATSTVSEKIPEQIFADYIEAAQAGDSATFYSLAYNGETTYQIISSLRKLVETEVKDTPSNIQKDLINKYPTDDIPTYFKNFKYEITDSKIENDTAALTIKAIIGGRQKKPGTVLLIKTPAGWKINNFGYAHPSDGPGRTKDDCWTICENKNNEQSLRQSPMLYEGQCYCWQQKPILQDVSDLKITECEEAEANGQGFSFNCYDDYAIKTKNEKYCLLGSSTCYFSLAVATADETICDNLWDDTQCLEGVKNSDLYKQIMPNWFK